MRKSEIFTTEIRRSQGMKVECLKKLNFDLARMIADSAIRNEKGWNLCVTTV